jgi:hypothetical protein
MPHIGAPRVAIEYTGWAMRIRLFAATLFAAWLTISFLSPNTANAKLMFGKDETIHFIQDVDLKYQDKALYLAHKVSTQFFLAGLYVNDDGYVLGIKGEDKRYFSMPGGDALERYQKQGLLPNPLPPYSLGFFDYLFGYSLWIILVVLALVYGIKWLKSRGAVQGTA